MQIQTRSSVLKYKQIEKEAKSSGKDKYYVKYVSKPFCIISANSTSKKFDFKIFPIITQRYLFLIVNLFYLKVGSRY